jgi:hypothetical protein
MVQMRRRTATRAARDGAPTRTGTGTATRTPTRTATRPAAATRTALPPVGGVTAAIVPVGALTAPQALDADVTNELTNAGPAFGDVLMAIGGAVARSQAALDKGMVDTARRLSATTITVVTDVIQKLDDDGRPVADDTDLITTDVSLINFVTPTVHEWEHVAVSMDLEVGEFDNEQGVRFTRSQSSSQSFGIKRSFLGLVSLNLAGASRDSSSFAVGTSRSDVEADFATGQVRLDAQLSPRRTTKFPVPAEVTIGPSIYFAQGTVTETKSQGIVTQRAMELTITVRKANGDVNPNVPLEVDADAFRLSFATGAGFNGSSTNAQGQVKVTLTRDIPNVRFLRLTGQRITARLGQVSNSVVVNL